MKISVVISSYNQASRLRYCLDSAIKMKTKFSDDIEIIVADDNSTDGSVELIKQYPVKLWSSTRGKSDKYTLAANWNDAINNMATGDRVLFTNGDHILTTWFADHHADPELQPNIIFGPAYQTSPGIENHIAPDNDYKQLMQICEDEKLLLPDRHVEGSAMTYNKEWSSDFPYGYNFSVMKKHFDDVGGFTEIERWGGEEKDLCDKIRLKFPNTKIVSNKNSVCVHLYHQPFNLMNRDSGELREYSF